MEITAGLVFFVIGIVGSVTCIVLLCVMEKNWKKQRKRMLQAIEVEE